MTMPIANILKYELKVANTIKEVKHIIMIGEVFVNGKKISDYKYPVGFTDVVSLPKLHQDYRLIIDTDGILKLIPVTKDEAKFKITKIIGKSFIKGKTQLNLLDGRNILYDKQHYKVGDSLLLSMSDNIVKEHLSLEKGMLVLLYKGAHVGKIGTLHDIKGDVVFIHVGSEHFETKKDYVLVVGKSKPEIKITK